MATRSVIARPGSYGWEGRYHHYDGHPHRLGNTLLDTVRGHFAGDVQAAVKFLIDDHPAGWSSINGADFSLPAGFRAYGDRGAAHGPECYCHGDRNDPADELIGPGRGSTSGVPYAYVLRPEGLDLLTRRALPWDKRLIVVDTVPWDGDRRFPVPA